MTGKRRDLIPPRRCSYRTRQSLRRGETSEPELEAEQMITKEHLRLLPKAELHSHVPGATSSALLSDLAKRIGRRVVPGSFTDLGEFISHYLQAAMLFRDADDFYAMGRDFAATAVQDGVLYAEVTFSPALHAAILGYSDAAWNEPIEAFLAGLDRETSNTDLHVDLVVDIVRDAGGEGNNGEFLGKPARSDVHDRTVDVAIRNARREQGSRVVALGLGGNEFSYPPEMFRQYFAAASEGGLFLTAHAGEGTSPDNVRAALDILGVQRIDHGISALQDSELIERLAREQIPLTVCPTSNIRLGSAADLSVHPIWDLHKAGINVTLNTDDRAMFDTTLTDEYDNLVSHGMPLETVIDLAHRSWESAWGATVEERSVGHNAVDAWATLVRSESPFAARIRSAQDLMDLARSRPTR